jgi:hypothetical protein
VVAKGVTNAINSRDHQYSRESVYVTERLIRRVCGQEDGQTLLRVGCERSV